ncbi:hypothetical protein [Pseudomonas sp. MF6747]|uniref:hypothetical protein n=1 Tax=Pseudomonas sp. MF6747 TaxID=2797527 RepID=UPI00190C98F8|nr:hypothetical protein [Pseudomonas sp. MF6747]MBK3509407.1 hypothetical protein [Pseudomonas sp. MF6747]
MAIRYNSEEYLKAKDKVVAEALKEVRSSVQYQSFIDRIEKREEAIVSMNKELAEKSKALIAGGKNHRELFSKELAKMEPKFQKIESEISALKKDISALENKATTNHVMALIKSLGAEHFLAVHELYKFDPNDTDVEVV